MLGLEGSGKTTILHQLCAKTCVKTQPTLGFNLESTVWDARATVHFWDLSGAPKKRRHWEDYYEGIDAIIFVIDCSDLQYLAEANSELHKLIQSKTLNCDHFLIFANKQDLPGALPAESLTQVLGMHEVRTKNWVVRPSSGVTGDGLYEGVHWLINRST